MSTSSGSLADLGSPSSGNGSSPRQSGSGRLMSLRNKARNLKHRLSGGGGSGPLSSSKKAGKRFFSVNGSGGEESGAAEGAGDAAVRAPADGAAQFASPPSPVGDH